MTSNFSTGQAMIAIGATGIITLGVSAYCNRHASHITIPQPSAQVQPIWEAYQQLARTTPNGKQPSAGKQELFYMRLREAPGLESAFNEHKIRYESAERAKQHWNDTSTILVVLGGAMALYTINYSIQRMLEPKLDERPMRYSEYDQALK